MSSVSVKRVVCVSFQLFIKDNQGGEEVTQVDYLGFIGSPVSTTNMADFKRVSSILLIVIQVAVKIVREG